MSTLSKTAIFVDVKCSALKSYLIDNDHAAFWKFWIHKMVSFPRELGLVQNTKMNLTEFRVLSFRELAVNLQVPRYIHKL